MDIVNINGTEGESISGLYTMGDRSVGSVQQNAVTTVSSCCIIHGDKNVATQLCKTLQDGLGRCNRTLQNVAIPPSLLQE